MLNTQHHMASGSGPRLSQIVTRKLADWLAQYSSAPEFASLKAT